MLKPKKKKIVCKWCGHTSSITKDLGNAYQQGREDVINEHKETFEWCHDCREYDRENHCCHRWSKRIRETTQEIYQQGRADAIDEFRGELTEMRQRANGFHDSAYAVGYISAVSTLEGFLAMIKEKK